MQATSNGQGCYRPRRAPVSTGGHHVVYSEQWWGELFNQSWNNPPRFTTMHRPGIASVAGDRIILHGTTVEEVERYHRDTLVLAVDEANEKYRQYLIRRQRETQTAQQRRASHRDTVASIAKKVRFD